MSDETEPEPTPDTTSEPDEARAAVTAAQLSICTQTVPEALELRLAAYQANPSLGRTAGHRDPKVRELEEPYLRARPVEDEPTTKPAGARRTRTTKKK